MGGKSRKTGGVSKKLIHRLMKEQQKKKARSEDVKVDKNKKQKEKDQQGEPGGFGF